MMRRAAIALLVFYVAQSGCDVAAPDADPLDYPLHNAVARDSVEEVSQLLDAGIDIDMLGPGSKTPLLVAALTGSARVAVLLLARGANTSIGEAGGFTPLHAAAFQGRTDVLLVLLEAGLDPLDYSADGYTALHRACWGREARHTESVAILLAAGVPPDQRARPMSANHPFGFQMTPYNLTKRLETAVMLAEALLEQALDPEGKADANEKLAVARLSLERAHQAMKSDFARQLMEKGASFGQVQAYLGSVENEAAPPTAKIETTQRRAGRKDEL